MKIAVGPNAHGMEVYERLMIDPKGNLVRVPWDAKIKPGWVEATDADLPVADEAQKARLEREKEAAEKLQAERAQAAQAQAGGPIVRARQELGTGIDPGTPDARPVSDSSAGYPPESRGVTTSGTFAHGEKGTTKK